MPSAPAGADHKVGSVAYDGWWNRANVGLPVPAPSTVPANAIAVGATGGNADKAAGVSLDLVPPSGSRVTTYEVTLAESNDSNANSNTGAVVLTVCPISAPWSSMKNGSWSALPPADCNLASVTIQAKDARDARDPANIVWHLDVTPIGQVWADGAAAYGLLITEGVTDTSAFQVSWLDSTAGRSTVTLDTAAPKPSGGGTGPAAGPPPPATAAPAGGGGGGGPASPTTAAPRPASPPGPTPLPSSAPVTTSPRPATPVTVSTAAPAGGSPVAASPTTAASSGAAVGAELPAVPASGTLPWWLVLLVPAVLAGAVVTGMTLGPEGRPRAFVRQGGVSRALARRAAHAHAHVPPSPT